MTTPPNSCRFPCRSIRPKSISNPARNISRNSPNSARKPSNSSPGLDDAEHRSHQHPEQDLQDDGGHLDPAREQRDRKRGSGDQDQRHRSGDAVLARPGLGQDGQARRHHDVVGTVSTDTGARASRWPTIPGRRRVGVLDGRPRTTRLASAAISSIALTGLPWRSLRCTVTPCTAASSRSWVNERSAASRPSVPVRNIGATTAAPVTSPLPWAATSMAALAAADPAAESRAGAMSC